MEEKYPTPIETLHKLKGSEVVVELRNKEKVSGKLVAFDLYINITLDTDKGTRFLQGTSVNIIYRKDASKEEISHLPQDTPAQTL